MTTSSSWNPVAKSFHWIRALLIFVAATLGWVSHEASLSPGKLQLYIWHKSVGLTVLGIMILRLVWRLTQQSPPDVEGLSQQNHKLANYGHFAVYVFAILMPLSGWILNSAANYPFKWFGWFEVPMLVGPSESIQASASTVHLVFFWVLAILVVGHIAMAFKHHLAGIPLLVSCPPWQSYGLRWQGCLVWPIQTRMTLPSNPFMHQSKVCRIQPPECMLQRQKKQTWQ